MKLQHIVLTALALALAPASSQAAVITPTSAESSTNTTATNAFIGSSGRSIDKTIDSSGLSGGGTSGDILTETHSLNENDTGAYWLSELNALSDNQVLTFTIPTSDVSAIHHWIYTRVDNHDRAIKTFDISFSTDGGLTFPTTITAATLGDFTIGNGTIEAAQTKTFATQVGVTDIRLTNIQNFGGSYVGLSEIRFDTVPEPGSLALLGLGGLLVASRRRRASV